MGRRRGEQEDGYTLKYYGFAALAIRLAGLSGKGQAKGCLSASSRA